MSELTFSCPSCGQHIQCEKAYGGHIIHCPNCCAELRIPFSNAPIPTELDMHKAELVLEHTPTNASAAPGANAEVHCVCPICQTELRVPPGAASHATPVTAEVVRHATSHAPKPAQSPSADRKSDPQPAPDPKSVEREKQIAAGHELHISPYPPMKPRLSYILSGEQSGSDSKPKPPDDNKSHSE